MLNFHDETGLKRSSQPQRRPLRTLRARATLREPRRAGQARVRSKVKLPALLHPPQYHCYGGRARGATCSAEVAASATKVESWQRRLTPPNSIPYTLSCLQILMEFGRNYKTKADLNFHLTSQAKLGFNLSSSR